MGFLFLMRFIFLFFLIFLFSCKNYWGNPYKTPLPPRVVRVISDSLYVKPSRWWAEQKLSKVEILFQRPALAEYEVRLQQTKGLKILNVAKDRDPNSLIVTLEIKANAPSQKALFVFSKGKNVFTHEYPIRVRSLGGT